MSPLQLEILLHYYAHCGDYRDGDFSAPAVRDTIDQFRGVDLLSDPAPDAYRNATYAITQRGQAFVHHLLHQPLPVQVWVMPDVADKLQQGAS